MPFAVGFDFKVIFDVRTWAWPSDVSRHVSPPSVGYKIYVGYVRGAGKLCQSYRSVEHAGNISD